MLTSYDYVIRNENLPFLKFDLVDSNVSKMLCLHSIDDAFSFRIKKDNETEAIEHAKLEIELILNYIELYEAQSKTAVKQAKINSFISTFNKIINDKEEGLVYTYFEHINSFLTTHINNELKYCTGTKASIQNFSTDITDCLNYYKKDKWFKLRMLNQLDFILDHTMNNLKRQFTFILTDPTLNLKEGVDLKNNTNITDYKRFIFVASLFRPLYVTKSNWGKFNLNKVTIEKGDSEYEELRSLVDELNMSSFKCTNTKIIQNNYIVDVYFNNEKDTFTLLL